MFNDAYPLYDDVGVATVLLAAFACVGACCSVFRNTILPPSWAQWG